MRVYETPYYLIHTDLDEPRAAEAVVRMTRLAEEYRRRTRELGFTAVIRQRLPFYLFRSREDYLASGADPQSAGAFLGDRLVAVATLKNGSPLWNVVQHEAFHQFAAAVEGPDLPGWVNEGLGEYFGEGLFTGDGFVTGVVPRWRAQRVQKSMNDGRFKPLDALLDMTQDDWNRKIEIANYDQAWSVVQFVLHGDGGAEGTKRLAKFIKAIAAGEPAAPARDAAFGATADFERRWRQYWQGLPDEPTAELYARAKVATVTSFVARAAAAGRSFQSIDELEDAARGGATRCRPDDWLPPQLLQQMLVHDAATAKLSLEVAGEKTRVIGKLPGGNHLVGAFTLENGRVKEVVVRTDP